MRKNIFSIFLIVLGVILILASVLAGIRLFKLLKAESYINGTLNVRNTFETDYFNYASNSVVFYESEDDTYFFEIDLLPMLNFDGTEKEYLVTLNKVKLFNSEIFAGEIFTDFSLSFYNTNNQLINTSNLNIKIIFLSQKTTLKLSTATSIEKQFLESYFQNHGFKLLVEEII